MIKEVGRPRGRTESDRSLDWNWMIGGIVDGAYEKERRRNRTLGFIGYLVLLVPICVLVLYFLKSFSNDYHVGRLEGMWGEEGFRRMYEWSVNPFGSPNRGENTTEVTIITIEELEEKRSTKKIRERLVE